MYIPLQSSRFNQPYSYRNVRVFVRFKSPNMDTHQRYSPRTFDVSKASPVAVKDLVKMAPAKPRPPRPKGPAKAVVAPTTSSQRKTSSSQGKTGKDDMNHHKKAFKQSFKMVTLTMGSLSGCMRRATNLTSHEISTVAARIDQAVHVLSVTRGLVFKAIEHFLYKSLAATQPGQTADGCLDPLDMLLHRQHGATLIRNLIALVLTGTVSVHGRTPTGEALRARNIAAGIYRDLKEIISGLGPTNPQRMNLGVAQEDLSVDIHTAIREHFGRLPLLLTKKVRMLSTVLFPVYRLNCNTDTARLGPLFCRWNV